MRKADEERPHLDGTEEQGDAYTQAQEQGGRNGGLEEDKGFETGRS